MPSPDPTPPPPVPHPAIYSTDRDHSPITDFVLARLNAIANKAPRNAGVFAKVGDSITESSSNLACFAGANIDLGAFTSLEATRAFFAPSGSFQRKSLAAKIGWSAIGPLASQNGGPSLLEQEIAATSPRYAVVMFGTNDVEAHNPFVYGERMLTIVDTLIERGVIPLMSTIPAHLDDATFDAEVPRYNAIVRGIAQARQVPLMDLHRVLDPLADHGLGPDGVHPTTYFTQAGYRACALTSDGLAFGYNARNALTLAALDRARSPVALDPAGAEQTTEIGALPYNDVKDTSHEGTDQIDRYDDCNAAQDESGNEVLYRFTTMRSVTVRAMVIDRGTTDIDVHLLNDQKRCLQRHDRVLSVSLSPGTYYFALDTFEQHAGEYLFVLMEE